MNKQLREANRGIALVSALVLLVSLTLVVVTAAYRNTGNELMASNQRDAINAMTIAESGIESAFALVSTDYVRERVFLVDELSAFTSSPLLSDTVSSGRYTVTVPQINANDVILNSTGNVFAAEREIEVILAIDGSATSRFAILTEDSIIALAGTPEITGPFANIHSNGDILLEGNPTVSGTVSATGSVSSAGNPDLGAEVSGAAVVDIPHVYPPEFRQYATVVFSPDCKVLSPEGVLMDDLSDGSTWHGWVCAVGEKWSMSGSADLFEGFYYIMGNLSLEGNPNGTWYASFIAEGNIEVSGNAEYKPWGSKVGNNTGDHTANEIMFLAGNDLMINGTPSQLFGGILAAHMEVHVSGSPHIGGSLVAENGKYAMGQEVTSGQTVVDLVTQNSVEGSMTMDATGTAMIGGGDPLVVAAWRELVPSI